MSSLINAPAIQTQKTLTFALIGNPNTGKSSLFNALSGSNAAVGNYAGVTVDLKRATIAHEGRTIELIDLPGTYSLNARSLDEQVSVNAVSGGIPSIPKLDGIIVVVDATAIERNLYLVSQLLETDLPILLVANMWDRLGKSGVSIDLDALETALGIPVITTCASKRRGIQAVKNALLKLPNLPNRSAVDLFPSCLNTSAGQLQTWFQERNLPLRPFQARRLLFDAGIHADDSILKRLTNGKHVVELREFLAECKGKLASEGLPLPACETRQRYAWIKKTLDGIVQRTTPAPAIEDRIDKVLTHQWFGLIFFIIAMLGIFQLLYSDYTTGLASGWLEEQQVAAQNFVQARMQPGALRSLITDGILAGIGAVLVFVPQIAALFLLLAILEDCGYMARVAMVMDRLMSKLGLNGKAFLPLMTSFGCAVPGILATRTISSRSDRLLTMLVAPLMSCSARLPVYVLMIYAFVPNESILGGWLKLQSVVLLVMLLLGATVAVPVAWLIRKFLLPGKSSPFVLELPAYKWPSFSVVFARVRDQVKEFVGRAGTLIFATAVVVWAMLYFPGDRAPLYEKMRLQQESSDEAQIAQLDSEIQSMNAELVRDSMLGRMGIAMEPAFEPLGWDWRVGVGVLASFPAREVVIATFGTIFALGGDVDETSEPLRETLQNAKKTDGSPLITTSAALSIMVFFALCAQCGATLIIMKRESGSWKWPIFTFFYMTGLAYVGALITYQVASRLIG